MLKILSVFQVLVCVCSWVNVAVSGFLMKEKISNKKYAKIRNVILCILISNIAIITVFSAINPFLITIKETFFCGGAACILGLQIAIFECAIATKVSKIRLVYILQALFCFIVCNVLCILSLI